MFPQPSVILFTRGSLSQHAPQVTYLGGSLSRGGLCPREWSLSQGGLCPGGVSVPGSGLCPRVVSVWGVSLWGGLCEGDPPNGNERAVRILLECILVISMFKHLLTVILYLRPSEAMSLSSSFSLYVNQS